uniref:Uncharacterized protein n=1 Tax=Aegilops tauschii subsp. strangulata TaxID=200361 RepID=A0A453K917_AEGTS
NGMLLTENRLPHRRHRRNALRCRRQARLVPSFRRTTPGDLSRGHSFSSSLLVASEDLPGRDSSSW